MAGFNSLISGDYDYKTLPPQIDKEELSKRVKALKEGDESQVNPICVQLMRLVNSIIAKYTAPNREADMLGVGLLTLVKAVKLAGTKLEDDNIEAFVASRINYAMKHFFTTNRLVSIPSATLKDMRKRGEKPILPKFEPLNEDPFATTTPLLDTKEIIDKIVQNDREKLYVEMRTFGFSSKTVATVLDKSEATVSLMKRDLLARYQEVISEE